MLNKEWKTKESYFEDIPISIFTVKIEMKEFLSREEFCDWKQKHFLIKLIERKKRKQRRKWEREKWNGKSKRKKRKKEKKGEVKGDTVAAVAIKECGSCIPAFVPGILCGACSGSRFTDRNELYRQ